MQQPPTTVGAILVAHAIGTCGAMAASTAFFSLTHLVPTADGVVAFLLGALWAFAAVLFFVETRPDP